MYVGTWFESAIKFTNYYDWMFTGKSIKNPKEILSHIGNLSAYSAKYVLFRIMHNQREKSTIHYHYQQ